MIDTDHQAKAYRWHAAALQFRNEAIEAKRKAYNWRAVSIVGWGLFLITLIWG